MKLFYLVSIGQVKSSNGRIIPHGEPISTFDSDLSDKQTKQVAESLACVNIDLVDKQTYESEYNTEDKPTERPPTIEQMRDWLKNSDAYFHSPIKDDWNTASDADIILHYNLCHA